MGLFKRGRDSEELAGEAGSPDQRSSLKEGLKSARKAMSDAAEDAGGEGLADDPDARDGKAEIKSVRDTRMTVGNDPVVEFDLSVTSGGFSYRVTHTQVVNRLRVGQLHPDAVVDVKIDAGDRDRLWIV